MKIKSFFCFLIFVWFYYDSHQVMDVSKYQSANKKVEVKGEVQRPGVYEVAWNATNAEVIKAAGGLKKGADSSQINLSQNLENQGVLVIGKVQKKKRISINSGTLDELDSLKGIGPSIAKRIIEYRTSHPFQSLDELKDVKGIGEKLYAKILADICL